MSPRTHTHHLCYSLPDLLGMALRGEVVVPKITRPFCWSWSQQQTLLEDVIRGLPIGNIVLLQLTDGALPAQDSLGTRPTTPSPNAYYLLDGHQRLATLLGALHPTETDTRWFWNILQSFFSQEKPSAAGREPPYWLPLDCVLDGKALRQFHRRLVPAATDRGMAEETITMTIETTDQIAVAFARYNIPITFLSTNDFEDVARTFTALKSGNTPASQHEFVAMLEARWYNDREEEAS